MSVTLSGVVTNGVIVPSAPLPEGAHVEIKLHSESAPTSASVAFTPGELRKLPRSERQAILAAAATLAEQDYRDDKNLTDAS